MLKRAFLPVALAALLLAPPALAHDFRSGFGPSVNINGTTNGVHSPDAAATNGALPHAATLAALRSYSLSYGSQVVRDGYAAAGDAPPLRYSWFASCPAAPDNVAAYVQPSAGGAGCWSAAQDPNISFVASWGAVDVGAGHVTGPNSARAMSAALAWCAAQKNGQLNVGAQRIAVVGSDLTIPLGCTLRFAPHAGWRNDGAGYQFTIANTSSALLLDTSHTINNYGVLENPAVFAYGLAPATSYSDAYNKVAAFAGTAITTQTPDATVKDALIVGFNTCFSDNGYDRPWLITGQFDCTNGIFLSNVQDVGHIAHVHGYAWFLNSENGTPYGVAFHNVVGVTNSGGSISLTMDSTAEFTTGQVLRVRNVGGFGGANGDWPVTVVDSTHLTLNGSNYSGVTVSGSWSSGETSITVASMAGVWANMAVAGTNIAANTTIESIDPFQNRIWLSQPTKGAGSFTTLKLSNPAYTRGGLAILDNLARSGEFLHVEGGSGATYQNNFDDVFFYGWKTGAHILNATWTFLNNFACDQYTDPANVCVWWDGNSTLNEWNGGAGGGTGAALVDTTTNGGDMNSMIGVNIRANVGTDDYPWVLLSFSGAGSRQLIGNFTPAAGLVSRMAQYVFSGQTTISGAMPFLDIYPQNENVMSSINVGQDTILAAGSPYGYQAALPWTPILKFGTTVPPITASGYAKVNWPWMTVKANLFLNGAPSGGQAYIYGLPFACQPAAGQDGDGGAVAYAANMQRLTGPVVLMGQQNAAVLDVAGYGSTGISYLSNSNFTSTSVINGVVTCKMAFVPR